MCDPFDSQWETVREPVPAFSYIDLAPGHKSFHRTAEFGPQVMFYRSDGSEAGMGCAAEVLLDFAEDGTILGIELLVPGTLVYERTREEES